MASRIVLNLRENAAEEQLFSAVEFDTNLELSLRVTNLELKTVSASFVDIEGL
jgi:hypothetical protein